MNRLFECLGTGFRKVPDGTLVNPFLNPRDMLSGLPWDLLDGFGIAVGHIDQGIVSEIHIHPFISQVTVLLAGSLDIHMKDSGDGDAPYTLHLRMPVPTETPGFTTTAALALPGTFFQIDNSDGSEHARVMYISSPAYLLEPGETPDAPPIYDDAVMVGRDWKRLAENHWNPPELSNPACSYEARQHAIKRLAARSRARDAD